MLALTNTAAASASKGISKGGKDTHNGKPICYNWNKGVPCTRNPCGFAHVCIGCKGAQPKVTCTVCAGGGG